MNDCFHRNLGEKISSIELDTPNISPDQLQEIEKLTNENIMRGVKMYPTLYESKDDPALQEVRFWDVTVNLNDFTTGCNCNCQLSTLFTVFLSLEYT